MRKFEFMGNNPNVKKFVFDFGDAIAEAVLYKYPTYEKRTVLCISVQSGCPVGCSFCGTGKKFIKNLNSDRIISQVVNIFESEKIDYMKVKKLQIMFMSMGEPFLNYRAVKGAIIDLNTMYPKADLLVSTIAPDIPSGLRDFLVLSAQIDKIGLQFSIHKSTDLERNKLIPYRKKLGLIDIRNYGVHWWKMTNRKVYLNYCIDGTNNTEEDFERLLLLFPLNVFNFTFSVICSSEENGFCYRDINQIEIFENLFINAGYDTRVFDPDGQDDIGGGCGQLWYVQEWMKKAVQ
ncbi:rRNA methyltransferase [bacterium]|nr:rRNA methyltransferase [bacterium]